MVRFLGKPGLGIKHQGKINQYKIYIKMESLK